MKGQKLIIFATAVALLVAIPAVVFAATTRGSATATPPTNIEANFKFKDTGTTLTITGKAKGMEPNHSYRTLIYGDGSLVKGIHACEPAAFLPSMFVGTWNVSANGNGTLGPVMKTGVNYSPLNAIATISVRGGTAGRGNAPVILCGKVE